MTFQELHEKYEEALSRVKELERENARLKKVLQERQIDVDDVVTFPMPAPKRILSVEERVELFRSLFKGREDVVGLYVLNEDNTCHLLCADFDDKNCEHGYQDDVRAFVDVCKCWGVPCSVERSRFGKGAHVWIFFESLVLAVKARRLGNAILTEAMNRDGRISFKSYDRFFPNQDTLPEGGLGNLVALPN